MSAVPAKPYDFHFFQQPFFVVRKADIHVRLTRHEATALYRWLKNMLRLSEENVWISMPAKPPSVDKNAETLHLSNVITLERWRSLHMALSSSYSARQRKSTSQELTPEPREPNLRARFIPLAQSRTSAVIGALDYLGQLSQRSRYRYTDDEITEIEAAITTKLRETIDAFKRGVGNRPSFQFRSRGK